MPPPPDQNKPSITTWTRLEPRCTGADLATSTSARVFDPLWLLTRQWQIGEFQAEDAGTPVEARVRATSATLTRCYLGELAPNTDFRPGAAPAYDPLRMPLEVMVERRRMRAADDRESRLLTLAVEAGLHFLRMLEFQPLPPETVRTYRAAFIGAFGFKPFPAQSAAAAGTPDQATERFAQTMVGRAPDARLLAAAFRADVARAVSNPVLAIDRGDQSEVGDTARRWLTWYDGLFSEPATAADDAWIPSRIEYAVSVSASLSARPEDEVTLSAGEVDDGLFDWSSFDRNAEVNMGSDRDRSFSSIVETVVPAPVSFRGAPAARFWEMEDARIAYGLLPVGDTDLAHLMMIEYASSYGNDWFVVPLTLPVGSLTTVNSLVVTDTFGVRTLLRPIGDRLLPAPHWSMWQLADVRRPGMAPEMASAINLFFLPPSVGRAIEGTALEDVLFMRDEMANLGWAIERVIENPIEQAVPRANPPAAADRVAAGSGSAKVPPRYQLSSEVPANWIPLLPVQLKDDEGRIISRLRRGKVLQPDGSRRIHQALGEVLNPAADLLLYDEELPREGVHVTRIRRMSRWIDGSTWVWTAFRTQIGRGEGSSGLRFDQLTRPDGGEQ